MRQVDSAARPDPDLGASLPGAVPGVGGCGRGHGASSGPHHQGTRLLNSDHALIYTRYQIEMNLLHVKIGY